MNRNPHVSFYHRRLSNEELVAFARWLTTHHRERSLPHPARRHEEIMNTNKQPSTPPQTPVRTKAVRGIDLFEYQRGTSHTAVVFGRAHPHLPLRAGQPEPGGEAEGGPEKSSWPTSCPINRHKSLMVGVTCRLPLSRSAWQASQSSPSNNAPGCSSKMWKRHSVNEQFSSNRINLGWRDFRRISKSGPLMSSCTRFGNCAVAKLEATPSSSSELPDRTTTGRGSSS